MMDSKTIFPIMLGLTFVSFLFYCKITFASVSKVNIKYEMKTRHKHSSGSNAMLPEWV